MPDKVEISQLIYFHSSITNFQKFVQTKMLTLRSSISEGETGGLSVSEPLSGPLQFERRPDVSGDASCSIKFIYKKKTIK